MSFFPLPEILQVRLQSLAAGPRALILDLGCGDGSMGRVCWKEGVRVIGLDLFPPPLGTAADVVGDACEPPILPGTIDLLLAGNLFRHLLVREPAAGFLSSWVALLKPDGWLMLLEDEPDTSLPSRRNYHAWQEFLAGLTPGARGPLLRLADFRKMAATLTLGGTWETGLKVNSWPADPRVVLDMLAGQEGRPGGDAARLIRDIQAHGLDYGHYWWACWKRK